VNLETIPLYCRAGAILPMGPVKQYADEQSEEPISLTIYPGADGVFSLYEDDGHTFDFRNGAFLQVEMRWEDGRRRLSLELAKGARMFREPERRFTVHVAGEARTRDVVFAGRPVSVRL
jgi:alpha-glucosidase (family GH31 glycosyl hydrolase)